MVQSAEKNQTLTQALEALNLALPQTGNFLDADAQARIHHMLIHAQYTPSLEVTREVIAFVTKQCKQAGHALPITSDLLNRDDFMQSVIDMSPQFASQEDGTVTKSILNQGRRLALGISHIYNELKLTPELRGALEVINRGQRPAMLEAEDMNPASESDRRMKKIEDARKQRLKERKIRDAAAKKAATASNKRIPLSANMNSAKMLAAHAVERLMKKDQLGNPVYSPDPEIYGLQKTLVGMATGDLVGMSPVNVTEMIEKLKRLTPQADIKDDGPAR